MIPIGLFSHGPCWAGLWVEEDMVRTVCVFLCVCAFRYCSRAPVNLGERSTFTFLVGLNPWSSQLQYWFNFM